MILLADLVQHLDAQLAVAGIDDYCPNGLQVEGKAEIKKIVTGVTASQRLLERALEQGADAILVHHGYFWKNEPRTITGMHRQRLATLLHHDVSLLAYHLPLDLHQELGNNVALARVFGWQPARESLGKLLLWADLPQQQSGEQLAKLLGQRLQRAPLHIPASRPIQRVAWCTGAAQSYIGDAVALGCDAFISGEISESTVHEARESGIHYFAAGHHATERYGVQALGDYLAGQFEVETEFIDCDNPV